MQKQAMISQQQLKSQEMAAQVAVQKIELKLPVVVRLSGTNVEQGRKMLKDTGLPLIMAETLREAADKAVAAWKENSK